MLYIKALHIIFVVTWFAGLFYIVRLFIYHREAQDKDLIENQILSRQYKIMQKRLWFGIAWPSMILTYIFGFLLAWKANVFRDPWFLLKLMFVFGLTLYHIQCHAMFLQMRRDEFRHSSMRLRIWNEVATIFLVAIVFIVVLKNQHDFIWGLIGLVLFSIMLYLGIMIYKRSRDKNEVKEIKGEEKKEL